MRVPGKQGFSVARAKARGADVRILLSDGRAEAGAG